MFKILLALHLLTAIFAIGPLVGAVTAAARGLRTGDASATASTTRTLTVYGYASVVVVILGMGLMSQKAPWNHKQVADFGDTWIWLSVLLWAVSLGLLFGLVVPALKQATSTLTAGGSVDALKGRVAAGGGVIGLIYLAIVFLMVYQPGS
jgi:uncharacterized membrane protein